MNNNKEMLYNDILKIKNTITKSFSKKVIYDNYRYYFELLNIYEHLNGYINEELLISLNEEIRLDNYAVNHDIKYYFNYFENNKDSLIKLADNTNKLFKDINFYYFYYLRQFKNFNSKDIKEIILDFYSNYGNKIYNVVHKYMDEDRIVFLPPRTDDYAGCYMCYPCINSGYIVCNNNQNNTDKMATVVHEFGHAIDAEMFLMPQSKKLFSFDDL